MRQRSREEDELVVHIPTGGAKLEASLAIPSEAQGIVAFAHGSGSSRHSPRNRLVAERLHAAGLGTLLLDLLTMGEEVVDTRTGHLRFDIPLLASRLTDATQWLATNARTRALTIGYFGASTGAAAALLAAATQPERICAVVSRGGRPDLAGDALRSVRAPTLLIVGGADRAVLHLNEEAFASLPGEKDLLVVPGATHLFEEAGALETVADVAAAWFGRHLPRDAARDSSAHP